MLVKIIFFLFLISIYQNNKKILKKNINLKFLKKSKILKNIVETHSQMLILKKVNHIHSFQTCLDPKPRFRVLTESLGHPGQFFFKSKRHRFIKKNKNQRIATEFLIKSCQVNWVFPSSIFSLTRFGSSPWSTCRAGFQNYNTHS